MPRCRRRLFSCRGSRLRLKVLAQGCIPSWSCGQGVLDPSMNTFMYSSMGRCMDHGMDGSVDRWIGRPSSHSSIHPLTPVGEVSIPLKRATGEIERSSLNLYLFIFFKFLLLSDREPLLPDDRLVCPAFARLKP